MCIFLLKKPRLFALQCLLVISFSVSAQQFKNEDELKKEAASLFEDEEYTKAYSLYSQLVSNYPKDPEYNYRLGVCMLFSEPDKKKCYSYLKLAAGSPKDAPKDATFFLAKAYHINYKFDDAIKLYNDYKKIASAGQIKRLQVDREIKACQNGKRLLASLSELVVINKKQLNEADYFRSYDLTSVGGKLLVKPEQFKTFFDKKKKDKSVVYIPKTGDKIYYSSYGADGENGRDIYFRIRLPNGDFGEPQRVPGINTEFDEDYPFLHPNGKTIYFSSKGYNSMGGYDIFKSTFDEASQTWSPPVNMEFPINSPDDDYLFVTDESEKIAFFSTGRQSPPGKIDVLKINTERRPMEMAIINGTVLKEDAAQSLKAKITVKNMDNGEVVGVYTAADNGDYSMEIPNGGKFIFTVETPGLKEQSDKVSLPLAMTMRPFKQSISYEKKVLKIINYFDSPPDDESYLRYLELIEKKAKLDVNENLLKTPTLVAGANVNENGNAVPTTNPTANGNNSSSNPTIVGQDGGAATQGTNTLTTAGTGTTASKAGMTNTQLVEIAKTDAIEAKNEAAKMNQDAADAIEIAGQKKIEADKLQKEADDAFTAANAITDEAKKKEALEKATQIREDAVNAKNVATAIGNFAQNLESDAKAKQKEAELNEQYSKELEKAIANKNNKDALAKLDDLQKQIEAISKQKSQSDEQVKAIKSDYDQKQSEITKAENRSNQIRNDIEEVKKEIAINDGEVAKTKDKSLKESLNSQTAELKKDLDAKTGDLAANEQQLSKLKEEAAAIQNEIDLANKIKTSDFGTAIAGAPNSGGNNTNSGINGTSINSDGANTNGNKGNAIAANYQNLSDDYAKRLEAIANPSGKSGLEESNKILSDYNKKLSDLIAIDKLDLKSAKKAEEKKKISDEIKQYENQKKINDTRLAENTTKLKQIDTQGAVAGTNPDNATKGGSGNEGNGGGAANTTTGSPIASGTEAASGNTTSITNPALSTNNSQPITLEFNGDNLNKLASLKTSIDNTNNPAFKFTDYKEQSSLSLKTDAELKLQTANKTKDDLAGTIAKAEEDLKNNPPASDPDVINKEADSYNKKATAIRIEAEGYQGTDKENMLKEARDLTDQSNKKHLEAAVITKANNKNTYDINNQNIDDLITTNKSSKSDIAEAQKLNEEAKQSFKQAISIREEADAQPSDAAKLGTISNAEEKEAEALAKQKQAVDLLVKGNPDFVLKTADAGGGNENLNKVKQQFDQLNKEKLDAYMALSKANQNEIRLQLNKLNQKPAIKNNSNKEAVNYKKQAEAYNKDALALISKALTEPNASVKQSLLMEANKKEIDAITDLNNANAALEGKAIEGAVAGTKTGTETDQGEPKNNNNGTNVTGDNSKGGNEAGNTGGNESLASTSGNSGATGTETKSGTANENAGNGNKGNEGAGTTGSKSGNDTNGGNSGNNGTGGVASRDNTTGTKSGNETNQGTGTEIAGNGNKGGNEGSSATGTKSGNETNQGNGIENSGNSTKGGNESVASTGTTGTKSGNDLQNNGTNSGGNKENNSTTSSGNPSTTGITSATTSANPNKVPINPSTNYTQLKDTSLSAALGYFDRNTITLKNNEADNLKNKAINSLKNLADEQIKIESDINSAAAVQTPAADVKNNMTQLGTDADNASKQARDLRAEAAGKQGSEKDNLIAQARDQENKSAELKLKTANLQKELNDAQYNSYNEALNTMLANAKDKPEAEQANQLISDAATLKKQAASIRAEASTYPTAAAKLGGYSNAEEKELELMMKQEQAISLLRKYSPDLVVKEPTVSGGTDNPSPELKTKYDEVNQKEIAELEKINTAFVMEHESSGKSLPANPGQQQKALKGAADNLIVQAKGLISKANQATDLKEKKSLLVAASKKGQEAVVAMNKAVEAAPLAANTTGANGNRNNRNNTGDNTTGAANPRNNRNNTGNNGTTGGNAGNTAVATNNPRNNTGGNAGNNTPRNNRNNTGNNGNTGDNSTTAANPTRNNRNNNGGNESGTTAGTAANPRTNRNNTGTATENTTTGTAATAIKVEGLEVKTTNAYSAANPIPVDQKMQDGVVFRVQIGAFKTALPPNTFKGLSPVNAQTTANGYIRYTAGNFTAFEIANAVKNDLRNLGYSDAFVVGYYDGKRITVSEAVALLEKEGKKVDLASNTSAGISATANIPRNAAVTAAAANAANTVTDPVVITSELEKMNGLLFTVQIGVYSRQVNKFQLYNLTPIYTEKLPSGLYRYTAGIYNQAPKVTEDQGKVVNIGIKDAFVSSYFNGKRIPFPDGQKIQKDSANVKMEPENPIVFGNNTNVNPNPPANNTAATPANAGNTGAPAVAPFSNGVTSGPAPTAENGVKADEAGISFKVQIGAYSKQVPQETAAKFLNIKTWPIANKVVNGLYIYTIGNFVDAKSAKKLKDEAVAAGISDAFICVYKDGKKLYGAEAASYLQR